MEILKKQHIVKVEDDSTSSLVPFTEENIGGKELDLPTILSNGNRVSITRKIQTATEGKPYWMLLFSGDVRSLDDPKFMFPNREILAKIMHIVVFTTDREVTSTNMIEVYHIHPTNKNLQIIPSFTTFHQNTRVLIKDSDVFLYEPSPGDNTMPGITTVYIRRNRKREREYVKKLKK